MLFAGEFEAHANARARTIRDAPPQDSQVDVAAAALQDPEHALRLATSMLEVTMPWEVTEALTLVAAAALRAGVGERIRARVQDSSFASEQAAWLQAAVLSGAMLPDEAVELASALAPAISEGLEANRELVRRDPVAGRTRSPPAPTRRPSHWRWNGTYRPQFSSRRSTDAEACPEDLDLGEFAALKPEAWAGVYKHTISWFAADAPEESCADAIVVAANTAWRPLPGSLADIINWQR